MNEQLISFETAKLAKEKGFDDYDTNCYDGNGKLSFTINIPLYLEGTVFPVSSQTILQKWLREKHNIHLQIYIKTFPKDSTHYDLTYWCVGIKLRRNPIELFKLDNNYKTYEEALEDALQKALKLI